ncbi:MAG TPA: hotdog domain-containing protein [Casimicrobiaceae bacterium]|nr:hotdog domain-containing protein [Casimicrobiaceae bacterium]
MREPAVGDTAHVEGIVGPDDLATVVGRAPTDSFPPVFATSRMIAWMEVAGARVLQRALQDGELSVGVSVDVNHTAATAAGETVVATARYVGREGKLFVFDVSARDAAGEIGKGTHKRAIVDPARLVASAAKRKSGK